MFIKFFKLDEKLGEKVGKLLEIATDSVAL